MTQKCLKGVHGRCIPGVQEAGAEQVYRQVVSHDTKQLSATLRMTAAHQACGEQAHSRYTDSLFHTIQSNCQRNTEQVSAAPRMAAAHQVCGEQARSRASDQIMFASSWGLKRCQWRRQYRLMACSSSAPG